MRMILVGNEMNVSMIFIYFRKIFQQNKKMFIQKHHNYVKNNFSFSFQIKCQSYKLKRKLC